MSEREEYTPSMDRVRHLYARTIRPDGTVELASRRQKEFDRWLAAYDRALREQIAREILAARVAVIRGTRRWPQDSLSGYADAARIARGEGSE